MLKKIETKGGGGKIKVSEKDEDCLSETRRRSGSVLISLSPSPLSVDLPSRRETTTKDRPILFGLLWIDNIRSKKSIRKGIGTDSIYICLSRSKYLRIIYLKIFRLRHSLIVYTHNGSN